VSAAKESLVGCVKCGTENEPDARFCGSCGDRLEASRKEVRVGTAEHSSDPDDDANPFAHIPESKSKPIVARHEPEAFSAAAMLAKAVAAAGPKADVKGYAQARSVDRLVGSTLNGRYLLDKKIGEGGFGAVFRGKQLATGREVALKILHPHNVSDATVVARFKREAEACSKLRNPHTVITYDFDETEDGVLYLAMELLPGSSLQQLQKKIGIIEPHRVLRILDQVAEALGEAHQLGIIHRDMKPENIIVEERGEEDFVKVLDFGIAKIVKGDGSRGPALTAIGQTVGTLEFMSPEQLRGKDLDGRSDIYALGMMAYEMLTGDLPFKDAGSSTEVIEYHLHKPPPAPSSIKKEIEIPAYVDGVVLKMVAKAREDRHADVNELRAHIKRALSEADKSTSYREFGRLALVVGGLAAVVALLAIFASR